MVVVVIWVLLLQFCSLPFSSAFTQHFNPYRLPATIPCARKLGKNENVLPSFKKQNKASEVLMSSINNNNINSDDDEEEDLENDQIPESNVTSLTTTTPITTQNSNSSSSALFGVTVVQLVVAASCLVGRLPVLNSFVSLVLGKGLILAGLITMGYAWYQTSPSNEDDTKELLVTSGLFAQVRHPFCAGQLLALLGWAAGVRNGPNTPVRLLLVAFYYLVLRKKTQLDEEELSSKYGHDYKVYKVLVKGRLIPHAWSQRFN